jgi:hypothetical protein
LPTSKEEALADRFCKQCVARKQSNRTVRRRNSGNLRTTFVFKVGHLKDGSIGSVQQACCVKEKFCPYTYRRYLGVPFERTGHDRLCVDLGTLTIRKVWKPGLGMGEALLNADRRATMET